MDKQRKHKNVKNARLSQLQHDELVHSIKKNPRLIGLENVVTAAAEVECYDKDKLVTAPDLVFYLGNSDYVAVEVKTSNSKSCISKMKTQLERYYEFFLKYLGIKYDLLGVYVDNDELKVIRYSFNDNRTVRGEIYG